MPDCKHCGHQGTSASVRRLPSGGYSCKDKTTCDRRRLANLNDWYAISDQADQLRLLVASLIVAVDDNRTLGALDVLKQINGVYSELALELAKAAIREGKTQKKIAQALGVSESLFRGLKAAV